MQLFYNLFEDIEVLVPPYGYQQFRAAMKIKLWNLFLVADTPRQMADAILTSANAFGRQIDSFEADLAVEGMAGGPFPAVFIRAPYVERADNDVDVLASVDSHPVLVRQGPVLAAAFHPELSGDFRPHQQFLKGL